MKAIITRWYIPINPTGQEWEGFPFNCEVAVLENKLVVFLDQTACPIGYVRGMLDVCIVVDGVCDHSMSINQAIQFCEIDTTRYSLLANIVTRERDADLKGGTV